MGILNRVFKSGNLYFYISLTGVINLSLVIVTFLIGEDFPLELTIIAAPFMLVIFPITLSIIYGKKRNLKKIVLDYLLNLSLWIVVMIPIFFIVDIYSKDTISSAEEMAGFFAAIFYLFIAILIGIIVNLILSIIIVIRQTRKFTS